MGASVNLGGKLPGEDRNGLSAFYREFVENPTDRRVMIAIVDVGQLKTDYDSDGDVSVSPILRVRRIEIVTKGDMASAHRLLQRAWEDRSGTPVLPIELEDELTALFTGYDLTASFDEQQTSTDDVTPDAGDEAEAADSDEYKPTDEENDAHAAEKAEAESAAAGAESDAAAEAEQVDAADIPDDISSLYDPFDDGQPDSSE